MNEDYFVRYGCETGLPLGRSDYAPLKEAEKFFGKIKLGTEVTWKELWYSPIDGDEDGEDDRIIKQEEVKVLDFGPFGKMAVPVKERR